MSELPNREGCPEAVLQRIPWYPDQGLSEVERGEVEAHAATCGACRREISMIAGEEVALPAAPDADALYARILGRIEADAAGEGVQAAGVMQPVVRRGRARRRLALAASLLLAVGVGVLGGRMLRESVPGDLYRTAGAPAVAAPAAEGVSLDVIFRGDATSEQITAALRAIRATIVAGPSRLGVYRVLLTVDGDAPAAAKMLLADGTGVATFAEPVHH